MPEKSISDKVNYYKGLTRTLRKRIDILEKRMTAIEDRMAKFKHLLPKPECINSKKEKNKKDDFRKEFLKQHHPQHKEEE